MCFVVDWMNDEVVMIHYSRFEMLAESMFVLMGFRKADMFRKLHSVSMIHKTLDRRQSGRLGIWKVCSTEINHN